MPKLKPKYIFIFGFIASALAQRWYFIITNGNGRTVVKLPLFLAALDFSAALFVSETFDTYYSQQ